MNLRNICSIFCENRSFKMRIKAVVFDMDGTITVPILDFDLIRTEIGLADSNMQILEAMEIMTESQRNHTFAVLEKHEKHAAEKSQLNPGVRATLNELKNLNLKTAILTRNTISNAEKVFKMHNIGFDMIIDRNDCPAKPDPAGLLKICSHFKLAPTEAILVGDYIHDIETAQSAGSLSVLIKTHRDAELFSKNADFAIETMPQLIDIIVRLNNIERLRL